MRARRSSELTLALALTAALAAAAWAEPVKEKEAPKGDGLLDTGSFGKSKEPITVTADRLEYDYKANIVVYRGEVLATQGDMKLRSDTLTVTFAPRDSTPGTPGAAPGPPATAVPAAAPAAPNAKSNPKVQEIVAVGNVRIDDGDRWATGGRAVFEQGTRTVVLTEAPVMHEGPNEVVGERVVVFIDENRSVVEGGRKRVKAVVYPGKDDGLTPSQPPKDAGPSREASAGTGAGAATP